MCDWEGCDSTDTQPCVVRLHEHDGARPDDAATDEHAFALCVAHTEMLVASIHHVPWHEAGAV